MINMFSMQTEIENYNAELKELSGESQEPWVSILILEKRESTNILLNWGNVKLSFKYVF